MKDHIIRRILAFFLVISAILLGVAVTAVHNINQAVAKSDWVNHTHAVLLETEGILASLHATDAAVHTYLLTGAPHDLAASQEALAELDEHREVARALIRSDADQKDRFAQLDALLAQRLTFFTEATAAKQANRADALQALLTAEAGRNTSREIARKADQLKTVTMTLLEKQDTAAYQQAERTRWTVWGGVILNVALLIGAAWLIRDDLAARRLVAQTLRDANDQLEAKVQARTAELVAANEKLSLENLERQWKNQALEHQVHYNQCIIDSIEELVIVLTKSQKISRVNTAVLRATGFTASELINQPLHKLVQLVAPADAHSPLRDPIAAALTSGRDLRTQPARIAGKPPLTLTATLTVYPLRDGEKVVGGIATLQLSRPAATSA